MTNKTKLALALGLAGILCGNLNAQNTKQDSLNNKIDSLKTLMSAINTNGVYLENPARKFFPEDYSEKVYSENLCINTNEKKYYVVKKNEEEGIKDIYKINKKGVYEEAWLYLPEKQEWHEIGINSDESSVEILDIRIENILKENKDIKEIIFYHNHPGNSYPGLPSKIDFPSITDLFKSVYYNKILPDYKITNKIIAKENVIEFSLNPKGEEKLLEKDILWWKCLSSEREKLYKDLEIKCIKIE